MRKVHTLVEIVTLLGYMCKKAQKPMIYFIAWKWRR